MTDVEIREGLAVGEMVVVSKSVLDRLTVECDEWRNKALNVETHPAVTVLKSERDAARSEVEQLEGKLAQAQDRGASHQEEAEILGAENSAVLDDRRSLQAENARLRAALEEMGPVLRCQVIHQGHVACISCLDHADAVARGAINATEEFIAKCASGETLCSLCKIEKIKRAALSSAPVAVELEYEIPDSIQVDYKKRIIPLLPKADPIRKALAFDWLVTGAAKYVNTRAFDKPKYVVCEMPSTHPIGPGSDLSALDAAELALAAAREALKEPAHD